MSLLNNLKTDNTIAGESDNLGGFAVLDSNIYLLTIEKAFVQASAGGAVGLHLHTATDDGRSFRTTLWMTSSTAKGGTPYYVDKNGDKKYLPGFLQANAIAQLITGKEIGELDTEVKVVSLWSSDAGAEVPTKVEMLMDLLNKQFYGGIMKQVVNKNVKAADGSYVPSGETREENELDKVFSAETKLTVAETKAKAEGPNFYDQWAKKNAGKTKDRTGGAKSTGGKPIAAGNASAGAKPAAKSLFGE